DRREGRAARREREAAEGAVDPSPLQAFGVAGRRPSSEIEQVAQEALAPLAVGAAAAVVVIVVVIVVVPIFAPPGLCAPFWAGFAQFHRCRRRGGGGGRGPRRFAGLGDDLVQL